ncbi:DUF4167 domain-containing protein [Sedimentitalea nanhaiensis]|uniref:DUF4167 domain-containing protein n=1 Tax=Sedimentitalea nanhaiensis TaxID=999627 RepID=UPI0004851FC1|nr:DUF4167 domain-containing protein [Sedimentitalea nanhaiensis]
MRSSKTRSRSKSNRNRSQSGGNVVNRVFDSSGPEGKVRGTPQQIIEKYNQLARDAQLGNDRVAAENFQQHAEHYLRLLSEAQREMDARREEQERQNRERQAERDRERAERQERETPAAQPDQARTRQPDAANAPRPDQAPAPRPDPATAPQPDPADAPQPDVLDLGISAPDVEDSGLVETPESAPKKPVRKPRVRKPAAPKPPKAKAKASEPETGGNPEAAE